MAVYSVNIFYAVLCLPTNSGSVAISHLSPATSYPVAFDRSSRGRGCPTNSCRENNILQVPLGYVMRSTRDRKQEVIPFPACKLNLTFLVALFIHFSCRCIHPVGMSGSKSCDIPHDIPLITSTQFLSNAPTTLQSLQTPFVSVINSTGH